MAVSSVIFSPYLFDINDSFAEEWKKNIICRAAPDKNGHRYDGQGGETKYKMLL